MGSVTFGIPKSLAKNLADTYKSNLFIETGTYLGDTAKWACQVFKKVLTCEPAPKIYLKAIDLTKKYTNIFVSPLDSVNFLLSNKNVISNSEAPFFWLDAHPKGGDTYGIDQKIPLLEELIIIFASHDAPIIMIDDIRIFGCPEFYGFNSKNWPSIAEIIAVVPNGFSYYQYNDIALIVRAGTFNEKIIFGQEKSSQKMIKKAMNRLFKNC